jgi:hypothetical protein
MKLAELELLAHKAILEIQVGINPSFRLFSPVVQIWIEHKLSDFPIPHIYVGQRFNRGEGRNGHIYNLCAYQVVKYVERYKLEFDVNGLE